MVYQKEIVELLGDLKQKLTEMADSVARCMEALAPGEALAEGIDPEALGKLTWKGYERGSGEWAFHSTQDGEVYSEAKAVLEAIEKSENGRVEVGDYTYRLGRNPKFLQRFPKKGA